MTFSLWKVAVMVAMAVTACPAFATGRASLKVAGDSSQGALIGLGGARDLLATTPKGSDDWQSYKGLPMVGTLLDVTQSKHKGLVISTWYTSDIRESPTASGEGSLYLCMFDSIPSANVLLHHPASPGEPAGGVVIELVENRTGESTKPGQGWFLAVHDYKADDSKYSGALRLMAHSDPAKAAIFKYVTVDGKTVLKVVGNRDRTGQAAIGGYLMVPDGARRDHRSDYLAVSKSTNGRITVEFPGV